MEQNRENKILQDQLLKMASQPQVVNQVNQFNLNFFLHEKCKDAISITDFINSLPIDLSDLEYVGKKGYVAGISNIFLNGLRKLDVYKRPIHCSDYKREVLYIKEDKWEKDNEKQKITSAIRTVAIKNMKQLSTWAEKHPEHVDIDSRENQEYLNIIQSVGEKEDDNKIIKIISKEMIIDK
jgi:hypothetical protein